MIAHKYNDPVRAKRHQPDLDRLSTLTALVLLVYGLVRVLRLPTFTVEVAGLALIIPITINTRNVLLLLSAALTVIGADWLAMSHPLAERRGRQYEAWIVPGLAALVIGAFVTRLPEGPALWVGLIVAASSLIAVLVAEYLVIDPDDARYELAARGLEALAYFLLFQGFFTLRASGVRAVFLVPASLLATTAVSWRLLRLWLPQARSLLYGIVAGWATGQIAWGLHYWPIPPAQEALLLVVVFYLLNGLLGLHLRGGLSRGRMAEYALVGLIGGVAIVLLG